MRTNCSVPKLQNCTNNKKKRKVMDRLTGHYLRTGGERKIKYQVRLVRISAHLLLRRERHSGLYDGFDAFAAG